MLSIKIFVIKLLKHNNNKNKVVLLISFENPCNCAEKIAFFTRVQLVLKLIFHFDKMIKIYKW